MTLTIELTDETEKAIERKASRQGITSSEYVRRMAERATRPARTRTAAKNQVVTASHSKTCAEILAELKALDMPKGYGDPRLILKLRHGNCAVELRKVRAYLRTFVIIWPTETDVQATANLAAYNFRTART